PVSGGPNDTSVGEISVKTGNNARNGGKNSLNRLIRCVCGKKIGPDPRNFNQRVSLGRNDLLIRTFLSRSAKGLGYEKEIRDYGLNLFGMYGRKVKLSHSEMIEDNKKDLAVNDHGLTCPSTTDCSDRCSDYINPEHKKTIKALQDAGYLK
ncbi:hypothetical protein U9517_20880, partial [Escherichia coli]